MTRCEACYIDTVHMGDIALCTWQSIRDLWIEISRSNFNIQTLMINDRIYYLLGLIIIAMSIRIWYQSSQVSRLDVLW